MSNKSFFDYIIFLQRSGYLKTALDETTQFLNEMTRVYGSNPSYTSDINRIETVLTGLMSRFAHWYANHQIIDSRDGNLELRQINHAFTEFIDELKKLPEIGYVNFGKVEKEPKTQVSTGILPKWFTRFFSIFFIVFIGGIAYFLFFCFKHIDIRLHPENCYVTVKDGFADFLPEPDKNAHGKRTLTKNLQYKVIEVAKIRDQCTDPYDYYFKVKDDNLNAEGWIPEYHVQSDPTCYENK